MNTDYEIPEEEVKNMKPQDFIGTYTYDSRWRWIQYNERVGEAGDLLGLAVCSDSRVLKRHWWYYDFRCNTHRKYYRSLEDLVRDCPDEELLELFLKEHCQ